MNVLFLSTHLNAGGIARYILTLTKGLVNCGHRVYVATSGGEWVDELMAGGASHQTFSIRTKSELDPRIYGALKPLARWTRENRIDVIHAQTRITQVMAAFLSRMTQRPYLSTCHGFFKRRLSRRIFPCWGKMVIAISEPVKEHLLKDFALAPEKVVVIHNGVDLNRFPLIDEHLRRQKRRELGLEDHHQVIGIIARLSDVKGHDILLRAMKKLIKGNLLARLLIIGTGSREEPLKRMTRELEINDYVRFLPIIDDTPSMLSMLDVFVMPSRQEGLGLSVMEAQAVGLAVVASRVGGLVSLIEDGRTGLLVPPENADALSKAIGLLLNHREKAREMGLAARRFIEEKFSAKAMVEETLKVYQGLAAKEDRPFFKAS